MLGITRPARSRPRRRPGRRYRQDSSSSRGRHRRGHTRGAGAGHRKPSNSQQLGASWLEALGVDEPELLRRPTPGYLIVLAYSPASMCWGMARCFGDLHVDHPTLDADRKADQPGCFPGLDPSRSRCQTPTSAWGR